MEVAQAFCLRPFSSEGGGRGGGVLRISSDGDNRRIFLNFKFSIPGFFWVGKFGKYYFVWLDLSGGLSRDFFFF